jgi:hypothetical protein
MAVQGRWWRRPSSLWRRCRRQKPRQEEEGQGIFVVYSNRGGKAEGHSTKEILALRGGFICFSTNSINSMVQAMSDQCTNYNLGVFLFLNGVVCITLWWCCLLRKVVRMILWYCPVVVVVVVVVMVVELSTGHHACQEWHLLYTNPPLELVVEVLAKHSCWWSRLTHHNPSLHATVFRNKILPLDNSWTTTS